MRLQCSHRFVYQRIFLFFYKNSQCRQYYLDLYSVKLQIKIQLTNVDANTFYC